MSKTIKQFRLWLLLLLALLLLPFCFTCNAGTTAGANLLNIEGEVLVKKAGTSDWVTAKVDMELKAGDAIKAGNAANAVVTFFDGSTIELKSDTQVEIRELVQGKTTSIRLQQVIGESISRVKKLIDPASRYEIETPAAIIGVRGTIMSVTVAKNGTTIVGNEEGLISVTSQGKEVLIPEGKHSTINPGETPSEPLEGTTATIVSTPVLTDAFGDWFDSQGRQVTGPEYLDIEFSQVYFVDGQWIMEVDLRGALPEADTVTAGTLIEWDFLLDFDADPATGLNRPFLGNDIGWDYVVQLSLENNVYQGNLIEIGTTTTESIEFDINDNIVKMIIPLTSRQNNTTVSPSPSDVNWVVATVYYKDDDPRDRPSFTDKAPDEGHYTFP
jgi:hypothetical protein